jgi:hypothetical protein
LSEEEPKAVVVISASVFVVHFDKITNEWGQSRKFLNNISSNTWRLTSTP